MKKVTITLLLAILFSFSWSAAQSTPKAETAAISAAKDWLSLLEDEKYGESWDEAADVFKEAIQREQWINTIQPISKPLGKTLKRELKSSTYRTTLPGAPVGEYFVIQFETSFENNKSTTETITPALDKKGKWRVSGYYIK